MAFTQISIYTDSKNAEVLSNILFELGALSVSIEDQYEGTKLEQPIFDEPGIEVGKLWEHSKLAALFNSNLNILEIIETTKTHFGQQFEYELEDINDQDWVKFTQNQFEPIKIDNNLRITPSWYQLENPNEDPNIISVTLDPGLAFGTGSHPTTFMCLKWLANNVTINKSILDYGCGSGILAITAKKLGAKEVAGVDIDKQAIESSIYNATKNSVKALWYLPHQLPQKKYDIVIANILSNPLKILAAILAQHTKQTLILSGILDTQIEQLSNIYQKWFHVSTECTMDGWVLLKCETK